MNNDNSTPEMRAFRVRKKRQLFAMAITLALLLLLALLYRRQDLFGIIFTAQAIFGGQITLIGIFIVFSALNWRCPACDKYQGPDIGRRICARCGSRLQ